MAKEIKQRMYALFAVLGIVIFSGSRFTRMVCPYHSLPVIS